MVRRSSGGRAAWLAAMLALGEGAAAPAAAAGDAPAPALAVPAAGAGGSAGPPAAGAAGAGAPPTSLAAAPGRPSEAPLPSCLDRSMKDELGADLRPRGVQRRDFQKRGHLTVVARGGLHGGDLTSSSWIAGGALGVFLTEDLGLEASLDVTPLALDLDAPLRAFFGDDRFKPGTAYVAFGNVLWSPIHAKFKTGGGIVHADLLAFGGAGRVLHDAVQGVAFDAGAALDLFVSQRVTVRLDARDLMAVEEIAGEGRFTNNLIATAGLVLWLPAGF